MTDIHIGASGLPCVDASTGNIKLHTPSCCGTCGVCDDSEIAMLYKVEIEGTANGTCGNCDGLNATYVVEASAGTQNCSFAFSGTGYADICDHGAERVVQLILSDGTDVLVNYIFEDAELGGVDVSQSAALKNDNVSPKPTCKTWDRYDVGYQIASDNTVCVWTNTHAYLTAL